VSCEELLYVTHDILNPHPDDDWDESKEAEAGAEDDGETDSTTDDK
jgi:hypothetical protein